MERRKFIAGNWKMNLRPSEVAHYISELRLAIKGQWHQAELALALPFTHFHAAIEAKSSDPMIIAAQNLSAEEKGAFTGEIAGSMLRDLGLSHTLVGHSERRKLYQENSALVGLKAKRAQLEGLCPIACVGESLVERQNSKTEAVIEYQMNALFEKIEHDKPLILAYEPVWAIGTGLSASSEQAVNVHKFIRNLCTKALGPERAQKLQILYGGSVTPANSGELLSHSEIDGVLVGGASLKAKDFAAIYLSCGL